MAKALLERFGTMMTVFREAIDPLRLNGAVPLPVAVRVHELGTLIGQSLQEDAMHALELGSLEPVVLYLKSVMAHSNRETFRVLFLDGSNRLIEDRVLWEGSVDRVQVHVREIVRIALELNAVAVLVAHNHVSSPPWPTREDRLTTAKIIRGCNAVDVRVNDHIIVSRQGCYSMRGAGLLAQLESQARQYDQQLSEAA